MGRKGHALVDEASLGEQLGYRSLTTLETRPQTGSRTRFLTFVTATGGAAIARTLTSTDTFLLYMGVNETMGGDRE
jgi:hypothetical protein